MFYRWRYLTVVFVMTLAVVGLLWRMVDLTVIDRLFLQNQGDARSIRMVSLPAYRGMISDRNGEPLAISTPVQSVWANPKEFDHKDSTLFKLAKLLNTPVRSIRKRILAANAREFIYLKRGLNPNIAAQIKALNIPGINLEREFRRFYPEGEITSHIIGFTNIDDSGQEGLELAYDQWLQGVQGRKRVLKDRLGHIVQDIALIKEPSPGHNLTLSIDRRIQYLAYRALKKAVEKNKVKSGSVVVLDARTGEVLALVNQPTYNPNRRPKIHDGRYRNRAVTDNFEPGSVIKAFTVASALESGQFNPDTIIDTSPSWLSVGGNMIRDDRDNGPISVTQVLQRSSNVGVTKMTLSLPPEKLINFFSRVGFGETTGSDFPGESSGVLNHKAIIRPFDLATIGFGYGLSVTNLQLAHAYGLFANHGKLAPISFLRVSNRPQSQSVISPKIADEMLTMLAAVVEGGTGKRARVRGYRVAGKTGTARIAGPNGYQKDHHVATFVGIAPVRDPRFVVSVVLNDPQGGRYYGGLIAAPIFSEVMAGALRIENILPDNIAKAKASVVKG